MSSRCAFAGECRIKRRRGNPELLSGTVHRVAGSGVSYLTFENGSPVWSRFRAHRQSCASQNAGCPGGDGLVRSGRSRSGFVMAKDPNPANSGGLRWTSWEKREWSRSDSKSEGGGSKEKVKGNRVEEVNGRTRKRRFGSPTGELTDLTMRS
jgi:hypothetical protein